jgi:hypothetical protein
MRSLTTRSMMWATTSAFGAFALGAVLVYVGFLIGTDPAIGLATRVLSTSALVLAGVMFMAKVVLGNSPRKADHPTSAHRPPTQAAGKRAPALSSPRHGGRGGVPSSRVGRPGLVEIPREPEVAPPMQPSPYANR